jgi:hypothetical protein
VNEPKVYFTPPDYYTRLVVMVFNADAEAEAMLRDKYGMSLVVYLNDKLRDYNKRWFRKLPPKGKLTVINGVLTYVRDNGKVEFRILMLGTTEE